MSQSSDRSDRGTTQQPATSYSGRTFILSDKARQTLGTMVWDDTPPDDEAAHSWAFAPKADITGSPTQLLRGLSEPEAVETCCGILPSTEISKLTKLMRDTALLR
jgi:hypothetical protein